MTATADGLTGATATLTPQPAPAPVPRTPGVLPAPRPRPVATDFTKLTGFVIGTPSAYKGENAGIEKAFDGDTTTFLDAAEATGGNDCWLGLDLGAPKTITRIRFFPRTGWSSRMNGGKFQGSDTPDFSRDVLDLYEITSGPSEGHWTEVTDIATAKAFRYVRYLSPDDGWNNVAEVEVDTSP